MKIKVKITTKANMGYFHCEKDAIQEIELEDYVNCVVASEIGNAPLEACKAQAVASRTFAVSRGVLDGKIISDSASKAQAYIASRNNYNNCRLAANATEGQILTYNGKCATTYFSHSNGGRTYSCKEVWGTDKGFLVAQTDIWTAATGEKKNGHGIGLSQVGAIYAAKNGISYNDILDFYYPGTQIQQLKYSDDDEYVSKILEEVKVRVQLAMEEIKNGGL